VFPSSRHCESSCVLRISAMLLLNACGDLFVGRISLISNLAKSSCNRGRPAYGLLR
jgi:hypothetical protein